MHVSFKGHIKHKELLDTINGVKKGNKKAVEKLSGYAEKGIISTELYNKLMIEYRINKDKKDRAMARKMKSVLSVVILFVSMLCGLAYLIEQYGKGVGVLYVFLCDL